MHPQARYWLYAGTTIGTILVIVGVLTNHRAVISMSGFGIMGATLAVAYTLDHLAA